MTQVEQVRQHLLAGKSITPATAMAVYGISRLASCIEDLRNTGTDIDTVLKRDEMGKQYGEYRLRKAIEVGSKVQVKPGHGIGLPHWVRKSSGAEVLRAADDPIRGGAAFKVRFERGQLRSDLWLNDRELVAL